MMRATIADGVTVTLHSDRVRNQWIIFEDADFPEYEGEITLSDDPALFMYFKQLIEESVNE